MNTSLNNAPRLIFGNNARVQEFTLILASKNLKHLGQLQNVPTDTIVYNANFNTADELSFTIYKELNGKKDPLWDDVKQFSVVWVKELNEYFEITYDKTQANDVFKNITCTSLCEAELSQIILYGLEINTQDYWDDYAELHKYEDYELPVCVFYNEENPDNSLLNMIIEKAPHYSIGHVDDSLMNLQRTFSVDGTSIYDFMVGDIAKEFNCVFIFDSTTRTINAYDLYSVCEDVECDYYINPYLEEYGNVTNYDNAQTYNVGDFCLYEDYLYKNVVAITTPEDFNYDHWEQVKRKYYTAPFNYHQFYREEGITECPYCGNKHLYYFGNDTNIFVEQSSLTDEVDFSTDTDSIKNTFKLDAGDDYMTETIANANFGSHYIRYFSDETKSMMSDELVDAIEDYDDEISFNETLYESISQHIYDLEDKIGYYEHSMMPDIETDDTNATQEAAKLTQSALSPISLRQINGSPAPTASSTATNAVEKYAQVFVTPGRFKVEVNSMTSWTPGANTGTWVGTLKVTNYSDEDDVAITDSLTITFNGGDENYSNFVEQKIQKEIYNNASKKDSSSIWGILYTYNINTGKYTPVDTNEFTHMLTLYSLERLKSFDNAMQTGLEVLTSNGQDNPDAEAWERIYNPLKIKQDLCQAEMSVRQQQVDALKEEMGYYLKDADDEEIINEDGNKVWNVWTDTTDQNTKPYKQRLQELQTSLDFKTFLDNAGQGLYDEYCAFRREDTYSNSNFISDLYDDTDDNIGLFENAKEYLKQAKKELVKSATAQHSITSNLYNLLIIKEFQPLIKNFQLGNFIRVKCENDVYRMRLLHYEVNFGGIDTLNTQFSDMTYVGSVISDLQSILDSSKQMATSYTSVSKQSENGQTASDTFENLRKNGLNTVLYDIKSRDTEEVLFDEHGILCRSYDDVTDSYDDGQIRINSNVIAFTSDNWASVSTALGYQPYWRVVDKVTHQVIRNEQNIPTPQKCFDYGLNANFVMAGYIQGSDIVGNRFWGVDDNNRYNGFNINAKGDIENQGNQIKADGTLNLGKDDSNNYHITWDGTTLVVDGTLRSTAGQIGGWTIGQYDLHSGSNSTYVSLNSNPNNNFAIWAGGQNPYINNSDDLSGAYFAITKNGKLYATGAKIEGSIIADGQIQGAAISNGGSSENPTFNVDTNGNVIANNITTTHIVATGGTIGAFNITNNSLYYKNNGKVFNLKPNAGSVIQIGTYSGNTETYNFRITNEGKMYASKSVLSNYVSFLTDKRNNALNYKNTRTYDIGDFCWYEGVLYKNIVEIETPENFNRNHWQEVEDFEDYVYLCNDPYHDNRVAIYRNKMVFEDETIADREKHEFEVGDLAIRNIYGYGTKYNYNDSNIEQFKWGKWRNKALQFIINRDDDDSSKQSQFWMGWNKWRNDNDFSEETPDPFWKGEDVLTFRPGSNHNDYYLGSSNYKWHEIYCDNSVINTSDRKEKNIISSLSDNKNYEDFIMKLEPVSYKWKDNGNRVHLGLIAQDVAEAARTTVGDLSLFQASQKNGDYYDEVINDEDLNWGLRYEELIAPMIAMIQKQQHQINLLQEQIKGLKK